MGKRGDGLEELGFAIVTQCCLDYREAYRTGKKNELLKCKSFLESGRVELFTLYTFTGEQIIKDLDESLFDKYGSFEERRKKKVEQYKKKISAVPCARLFAVDHYSCRSYNSSHLRYDFCCLY